MGRDTYLLAGILVLATILRTVAAGREGLWMDEGLTLAIAHYPWKTLAFQPIDPTPGLYYLLHKALIPPEAPLIAIRAISIVSGIVSVGLMYGLGRVCLGRRAGLIAAALLAAWPAHVDYSQEARAYSLLFALILASALGLALYDRVEDATRRRLALALFAVAAVAAFYTHVTAAPFIAGAGVMLLWSARSRRRPISEIVAAFAGMAVLALPAMRRLWLQTRVGHSFDWLAQATPVEFVEVLSDLALPSGLWANPVVAWRAEAVRLALAAGAVVLLAAALVRHRKGLAQRPAAAVIFVFLAIPPLLWAIGFVAQPMFMLRSILIAAPGVILLMAALAADARRPLAWAAVLVAGYLSASLLHGLQPQKPRFAEAVAYVQARADADDLLIVCPISNYPAVRKSVARPGGPMVLGLDYDGLLLPLEDTLGSNRNWSANYFRAQLNYETRHIGERAFRLRSGQAVWVLDSSCREGPVREGLAVFLDSAGARQTEDVTATGELAWRWGEPEMGLRRYVLEKDVVWPVRAPVQAPRATNQPLRNPSAALP